MSQYGKAIELFLADGQLADVVTAERLNWSVKAIKIPRALINEYPRHDLDSSGVYFLFCESEGADAVYVGETENVLDRLRQHIRVYDKDQEKFYWTTAVAFTGKGLNKAHVRYLENRLCKLVVNYNKAKLLTKSVSQHVGLNEAQTAAMDEFLDNIVLLMNALGYDVLTPTQKPDTESSYLVCGGAREANARGFVSAGGFTVLKGSHVSDDVTESFKKVGRGYLLLREKLEFDKVIAGGVFTADYEFSSPSAASSVILGRQSTGKLDWKRPDGTALGNALDDVRSC